MLARPCQLAGKGTIPSHLHVPPPSWPFLNCLVRKHAALLQHSSPLACRAENENATSNAGRDSLESKQGASERSSAERPAFRGVNYINTSLTFLVLHLVLTSESFSTLALFKGLPKDAQLPPLDIASVIVASDVVQLSMVIILWKIAAPNTRGLQSKKGAAKQKGQGEGQGSLSVAKIALTGAGGAMAAFLALSALSYITTDQDAQNTSELISVLRSIDGIPSALFVFSIVVLGPMHEELFFRGYLLQGASKFVPLPVAVGLSALLFAGCHLLPGEFLALTLLGLIFGTTSLAAGNVSSAIIAHSAYNALVLYLAFQGK
ncbi:CAAX protease self-immunity-domain-containing protein [Dunaliella salina]|uniref:CAAX protease self-immunity-domain-containing protein n=1 Tax=Dunaliella salina TaxID=3046 RepID=A0ABQ7H722_DUNSA|nr:CAAX protease self-immunity-domain-containing protein [Dunaliella salina]|eukprot:KAF5842644.1 CAAX protease self-immunity-domain-containing protein [Dunaliella salina]